MKKWSSRKKAFTWVAGAYLLLWGMTALVGLPQVDEAFDRDLAMGSVGFGGKANVAMPVERIEMFELTFPPSFPNHVPETPWRCRSRGVAVAPFVIVDEAAWQDHILSGFGGRRLVFWAFGYVRWRPLKIYWVS